MKWLLLFVSFLLVASLAEATFISLTTNVQAIPIDDEKTDVIVTTTNHGDEAAYNVQIDIELNGIRNSMKKPKETLEVGEALSETFTTDLSPLKKPGTYLMIATVNYQDTNGYQFSAITPFLIAYKNPTNSKVYALMKGIELTTDGEATAIVRMKNIEDEDKTVKVEMVVPRELSTESSKTLKLKGREEKEIPFKISSFSALEGSSYAIFAVITYEDDSHYTTVTRSVAKIVKEKFPIEVIYVLIAVFVLLLGLFVYTKMRKKHESLGGNSDFERGEESPNCLERPSKS